MNHKQTHPPIPPRAAVRAALKTRAWLMKLAEKIAPPQVRAIEIAFGYQGALLLRTAARLKIADQLATGPKSAQELARLTPGVNADALHRTLRALASNGVFELDEGGRFSNNRISETLRDGIPGSVRAWAMYSGSKSNLAAWADYENTVATGKNAFERVHGEDCWTYFGKHPEEGATFDQAMADLTDLQAPTLAVSYPFSDFKIICDVAGGRGSLLSWILMKHPHVRGWLVDEPHVLENAGAFLASRGVDARVDRKPGNMFKEVPAGADVYLLKDILHDWDDERCVQILKNVRAACGPGKRVSAVEIVVEPTAPDMPGAMIDCHMMTVCCEGRQRSTEDFRRIYQQSGFRLEKIVPTSVPASFVEGIAV